MQLASKLHWPHAYYSKCAKPFEIRGSPSPVCGFLVHQENPDEESYERYEEQPEGQHGQMKRKRPRGSAHREPCGAHKRAQKHYTGRWPVTVDALNDQIIFLRHPDRVRKLKTMRATGQERESATKSTARAVWPGSSWSRKNDAFAKVSPVCCRRLPI